MTPIDIKRIQNAMLTVPGVTLPRFGPDGDWGGESWAAFALVIEKAGGQAVPAITNGQWEAADATMFLRLVEDLKRQEGCRLKAYQDTKGIWTIGYGHTGPDVREGLTWTQAQADHALALDVEEACAETDRAFPWAREMGPEREMVLRNWVFNMGVGRAPKTNGPDDKGRGVKSFVNTLRYMQEGDYASAANGMLNSQWARDVGPTRSKYLAEIMLTGRVP